MRNVPHELRYVSIWCPVSDAVGRGSGDTALLRRIAGGGL